MLKKHHANISEERGGEGRNNKQRDATVKKQSCSVFLKRRTRFHRLTTCVTVWSCLDVLCESLYLV